MLDRTKLYMNNQCGRGIYTSELADMIDDLTQTNKEFISAAKTVCSKEEFELIVYLANSFRKIRNVPDPTKEKI